MIDKAARSFTEPPGFRCSSFATIVRMPFASLGVVPKKGDRWSGNLLRVDRHPTYGTEYSAWRPTMKSPADFHVVAAFGEWTFA